MTRIFLRLGLLAGACWLCAAVVAVPPAGATLAVTWQWPLPGRPAVVRGFTPPATPYGPGHRGVDLAGRPGSAVLAAGAGVVGYAGVLAGRGVVTVLHDGGLRTTYEPVLVAVHAGQRVGGGALLGRLAGGHPGCRAAACLHWGLLRGETYLDPLALLGAGRVRLLPLAGRAPPGGLRWGAGLPPATTTGARHRASERVRRRPAWLVLAGPAVAAVAAGLGGGVPSAGRTSWSATGGRPSCASGRSGSP
jgi:hypothetical protein